MVDLGMYEFKYLNTGKLTPEESINNAYVYEVYESEHVRSTTKRLRVTLDSKYEKADLHKVMETQYQNLTITHYNEWMKLLQIYEESFDGTLGPWKTGILEFELKEDTNKCAFNHTQ